MPPLFNKADSARPLGQTLKWSLYGSPPMFLVTNLPTDIHQEHNTLGRQRLDAGKAWTPRRGPNLMCNSCYTRNPFLVLMLVTTLLPDVAVKFFTTPRVILMCSKPRIVHNIHFVFFHLQKKKSPTVLSTFMPPYPDLAPHQPLLHERKRRLRPEKKLVPEPHSAPDEEHLDHTSTTHVAYLSANSRRTHPLPASVATNSVSKTHTDFWLILRGHTQCYLHRTVHDAIQISSRTKCGIMLATSKCMPQKQRGYSELLTRYNLEISPTCAQIAKKSSPPDSQIQFLESPDHLTDVQHFHRRRHNSCERIFLFENFT